MVNLNGGYVLVDCTGVNIDRLGNTVDGIYDKVLSAIKTNKPIVLCNIVNDDVKFSPVLACCGVESDTSVFLIFNSIVLIISNDDVITD